MSRVAELWWERRRLWLPSAVLLALAVVALGAYRFALAGRVGLQAGAVSERREELAELSARRREAEDLLRRAHESRRAIDEMYQGRLAAESRRLTAVMIQVKQLARQAGLAGVQAIDYGDQPAEGLRLHRKSIGFAALGTYEQLRSFINLLEVSESFLTLEEIRVQDSAQTGQLALQIRLSTLFVDERSAEEQEIESPEPRVPVPQPANPAPARSGLDEVDA